MPQPLIYILFDFTDQPSGGGNQFLRMLRDELSRRGALASDLRHCNVILCNSFQYLPPLISLKRQRPEIPVIHRIDGPISLYNPRSDYREVIVHRFNRQLADATIFQSKWSQDANHRIGLAHCPFERVVHNCPDPTIFHPPPSRRRPNDGKVRLLAASWSDNARKGFATYAWMDEHLDWSRFSMTYIGRSPIKFRNIVHLQPMNSNALADQMRSHDIFVFASEVEACSNVLLEALSCGLPVVAANASSNPEVLGTGGLVFDEPKQMPDLLDRLVTDYDTIRSKIRVETRQQVVTAYVELAELLIAESSAGRYQPKSLAIAGSYLLHYTIARWQWANRSRRLLARVRSLVHRKRAEIECKP